MMRLRLSPAISAFNVDGVAGCDNKRSGVPAKANIYDPRTLPEQPFALPCDGVMETNEGNDDIRRLTPAGIALIADISGCSGVTVAVDRLIG
jgi:hypothetical protein